MALHPIANMFFFSRIGCFSWASVLQVSAGMRIYMIIYITIYISLSLYIYIYIYIYICTYTDIYKLIARGPLNRGPLKIPTKHYRRRCVLCRCLLGHTIWDPSYVSPRARGLARPSKRSQSKVIIYNYEYIYIYIYMY